MQFLDLRARIIESFRCEERSRGWFGQWREEGNHLREKMFSHGHSSVSGHWHEQQSDLEESRFSL